MDIIDKLESAYPGPSATDCYEAADTIRRLRREVDFLRRYGNKDCTAMADEAMREASQ